MIRSGLPGSGGLLRYLDWFGGGAAHAYCVLFQSSTSFITSVMTFLFPYIHTQNRGKKKEKEEFLLTVTISHVIRKCCCLFRGATETVIPGTALRNRHL